MDLFYLCFSLKTFTLYTHIHTCPSYLPTRLYKNSLNLMVKEIHRFQRMSYGIWAASVFTPVYFENKLLESGPTFIQ